MELELLPDEVLALVLSRLDLADLRRLACVCSRWDLSSRPALWYSLAAAHQVQMPRLSVRHELRSKANPRASYFASCARRASRRAQLADKAIWEVWIKLHRTDCVSSLRATIGGLQLDVNHQLRFYFGASLSHLAARKGRLRCIRALQEEFQADLNLRDDGGFTPLTMAAWAGHKRVVRYLLACGALTHLKGVPPTTSSCGGVGPYSAEEWASRKGFLSIARAIRMAASQRK